MSLIFLCGCCLSSKSQLSDFPCLAYDGGGPLASEAYDETVSELAPPLLEPVPNGLSGLIDRYMVSENVEHSWKG